MHSRKLEERSEEQQAHLAGVQQKFQEQLAEAQKRAQEQLAQADSRMQTMKQDMLEQHASLERRLRHTEEAAEARKATHEKTLSKLTAQQARKVCPRCPPVMLSALSALMQCFSRMQGCWVCYRAGSALTSLTAT